MSNFRTKDEVEENARKSHSIAEMCRNFGIVASGGNYKVMHNLIDKYHIDISHFTGQGWNVGLKFKPNPPKALSEILIENSYYQSYKLKQRLIDEHLKEHKCEKCGNERWYGQPIPLELHHINGNHNDNRLENLQLLCPNCHAQTDNYRGRNGKRYDLKEVIPIQPRVITNTKIEIIKKEKPKRYCLTCGQELKTSQTKYCSQECATKSYTKRIDKEELINALEENNHNLTQVGKLYNVSANAIKKWCKHYNIVKDNYFHTKRIQQYDLNNNFIKEFKSITEAMNETNITTIKKCLQGKAQSAGGFIWRYIDEENNS